MKTSNRFTIAPALGVLAFALFVICPIHATRAARATGDDAPRRMVNATPPVTLGDGQTFQVTYLNAGSNPFEIIPCVLDGDGAHLKMGDTLTLLSGQTLSFEMSRSEIVERTGSRMQIYGGVHVHNSDLKNLMLTGEVIEESTGRSSLFVPGMRVGFD